MRTTVDQAVLVLNASFEAINIVKVRRAILYLVNDKAFIQEDTGDKFSDGSMVPLVVRLKDMAKIPHRSQTMSRKNILSRDHYMCFGAGTRILMADGSQKSIEDVFEGDVVIDAHGHPTKVLAIGNSIVEDAVNLKHRGSSELTVTTPDHPFLSSTGEFVGIASQPAYLTFPRYVRYDLPMAKDIDVVSMFPIDWFKNREGRVYRAKQPIGPGLPEVIAATAELAYIIGLFVADGSTTGTEDNKGASVIWSFNINQKVTLAESVKRWANGLGLHAGFHNPPSSNMLNVVVSNRPLATIFRKLCGGGDTEKRIPWSTVGQHHAEFLRGLFHGDGCMDRKNSKVVLQMTSYDVIFGAQSMLWGLGIYPTVARGDRMDRKPTWALILQAENYSRFMDVVMGETVDTGDRIYGNDEFVFRKFKSLDSVDEDVIVYNMETESHSYIANGLSVHNCQYCDKRLQAGELTLDHIIPESRGGPSTWDNLVACCQSCNRKKADRTPEEAGMLLRRRPRPATIHTSRAILRDMGADSPAWQKYLFYDSKEHHYVTRG